MFKGVKNFFTEIKTTMSTDIPVMIAKKCSKSMDGLEGKFFTGRGFKIFDSNIDIYDEEGQLLCKFRKGVLTTKETETLMDLRSAAKSGYTRPSAAGFISPDQKYKYIISKSSGKPLHVLTSKSNSGIVGFYDTQSHFGRHHADADQSCRMTAFTTHNLKKYQSCLSIFQKVSQLFQKLVPDRYQRQHRAAKSLDPAHVIPKTVFTTVTVNKNFRTALHKDKGDLKEGFGIMVVASDHEDYQGCFTLFPEYKIGIDCRNGDLLAFDVHTWHCNSPLKGTATRLSFIFYLREKMMSMCPRDEMKK